MDEVLKQALEIVKAQASVRVMTEDEMASMVLNLQSQFITFQNLKKIA